MRPIRDFRPQQLYGVTQRGNQGQWVYLGAIERPVRLLLDTCSFIWFLADAPELSAKARAAILDSGILSLPLSEEEAISAEKLPLLHKDPFLIA